MVAFLVLLSQPMAFHVGPAVRQHKSIESVVPRSTTPQMPLFDFGTGNYAYPDKGKGIFGLSLKDQYTPYGRLKNAKEPNKFSKAGDDVVNVNPLPLLVVASSFAMPIFAGVSIFLTAPGKQLPFNFLDDFYAPRVAEKAVVKQKIQLQEEQKAAEKKKEEAKKAAAEAEAKAAAEAEAKAKAAAAATSASAKKVETPKPAPAPKPAPKPAARAPAPKAAAPAPKPKPVAATATATASKKDANAPARTPKIKTNYCVNCPVPIRSSK